MADGTEQRPSLRIVSSDVWNEGTQAHAIDGRLPEAIRQLLQKHGALQLNSEQAKERLYDNVGQYAYSPQSADAYYTLCTEILDDIRGIIASSGRTKKPLSVAVAANLLTSMELAYDTVLKRLPKNHEIYGEQSITNDAQAIKEISAHLGMFSDTIRENSDALKGAELDPKGLLELAQLAKTAAMDAAPRSHLTSVSHTQNNTGASITD